MKLGKRKLANTTPQNTNKLNSNTHKLNKNWRN